MSDGNGPSQPKPSAAIVAHHGADHLDLLAAEQAVLAAMRVERGDREPRRGDAGLAHHRVGKDDGVWIAWPVIWSSAWRSDTCEVTRDIHWLSSTFISLK